MDVRPYMNRLKHMPPREIAGRTMRYGLDWWRYVRRRGKRTPIQEPSTFRPFIQGSVLDREECSTAWERSGWHQVVLDELRAHRFQFAYDVFQLSNPVDWHHDLTNNVHLPPIQGRRYLFQRMYRIANMDFMRALNRQQFVYHIAKGAWLGKCRQSLVKDHIRSWIDSNGYLEGINWSDSLDTALRLWSWILALSLSTEPSGDEGFALDLQRSVFLQAEYIEQHLSLGSSANNHLLGEYMGLVLVGMCFPEMPKATQWLDRGTRGLEEEVLRQWTEDGVNREQSVAYHWWLLEHLLVVESCRRRQGFVFSAAFSDRIGGAVRYLADLVNACGEVPLLGDAGIEVSSDMHYVSYKHTNIWQSALRLAHRTGRYPDLAGLGISDTDDRVCWLAPPVPGGPAGASAQAHWRPSTAYGKAGAYILRDGSPFAEETSVFFRCGPMGYPDTCAHAHADQLSFVLSVRGRQLLIDTGTYSYHAKGARWRNYFRGTSAHNALTFDGLDQALSGGNMLWSTKSNGRLIGWETIGSTDSVTGTHDGFGFRRPPVSHARRISIDKVARVILIEDSVDVCEPTRCELFFHLHPDAALRTLGRNEFDVRRDGSAIRIRFPEASTCRSHRGGTDTLHGWCSPLVGHIVPCHTLVVGSGIDRPTTFVTRIALGEGSE